MNKNPFNPQAVPIQITMNYQQINLMLEGLGKLPFEKVETIYTALRSHAVTSIQQAEVAHQQATVPELPTITDGADVAEEVAQ